MLTALWRYRYFVLASIRGELLASICALPVRHGRCLAAWALAGSRELAPFPSDLRRPVRRILSPVPPSKRRIGRRAILRVLGVRKRYAAYSSNLVRFASWFGVPVVPVFEFRAVKDEFHDGEALALSVRNGAWKSTLFAGTVRLTVGHIAIDGRVSAVVKLGSGRRRDGWLFIKFGNGSATVDWSPDQSAFVGRSCLAGHFEVNVES